MIEDFIDLQPFELPKLHFSLSPVRARACMVVPLYRVMAAFSDWKGNCLEEMLF